MKNKEKNKNEIKFVTHLKDIPIPAEMPSPPDFLLQKMQNNLTWDEAQENLDSWEKNAGNTAIPEHTVNLDSTSIAEMTSEKSKIDYLAFQHAVEERISAETGYAEIYSKYIELTSFNEKMLRTLRRYQNFKKKIRVIYDRAMMGDEHLRNNFKIIQRNMVATEKTLSDMQIENESLRISLMSHEEAYKGALAQLGIQQAEAGQMQSQFQKLAEEFENRGILLDEADRKIRGYLTQIDQTGTALRELRTKNDIISEENILFENKMRETQLKEAGINALNEELAKAVTKSQKQIRELEDKLKYLGEDSRVRIMSLEQEVERLRDNLQAETLVEQSKRMLQMNAEPTETLRPPPNMTSSQNRKQWDDFYHRWSNIIDGLTSHSVPIDRPLKLRRESSETRPNGSPSAQQRGSPSARQSNSPDTEQSGSPKTQPETQLMSEVGDLEIL